MKHAPTIQHDPTSGRFFARLQVNGARKRFWLGSTKKDAAANLNAISKDIAAGRITFTTTKTTATTTASGGKDMRLEELAHIYMEWVSGNLSASTYATRRNSIRALIQFMGPVMVSSITRMRLLQFQQWARENHGSGPNRGNHLCRDVRTMFRWGEENEICDCPVRRFPRISHTPPRTKRFRDEDMRLLLSRIPDTDFKDMLVFGLLTGLRPQELRCLKTSEIRQDDHGQCFVLIEQHKTAKMTTNPLPRSVPLPAEAAVIVRRQVDLHPKSEFLFLNDDGTPYAASVLRRRLQRIFRD